MLSPLHVDMASCCRFVFHISAVLIACKTVVGKTYAAQSTSVLSTPDQNIHVAHCTQASKGLGPGPAEEIVAYHKPSNIEMPRRLLRCLRALDWLNDEVINIYMGLLQVRAHLLWLFFCSLCCSAQPNRNAAWMYFE